MEKSAQLTQAASTSYSIQVIKLACVAQDRIDIAECEIFMPISSICALSQYEPSHGNTALAQDRALDKTDIYTSTHIFISH